MARTCMYIHVHDWDLRGISHSKLETDPASMQPAKNKSFFQGKMMSIKPKMLS